MRHPKSRDLIVIGGGGHASVVLEAAKSSGWNVRGFVDPDPKAKSSVAPRLGDDSATAAAAGAFAILGFGGIGGAKARVAAVDRLSSTVSGWATVVHSSAIVSPSAKLGEGTVVCAGAIVQAGAMIGRHAVVNTGAIVEHDVILGDFSQAAPGSVIGGGAKVGARSWVGLGSSVRDHVTIGDDCVVAMGATVVADVADNHVVKGTPAR
jgi:sugar O-acyltransferase (sialic acid O-acetyltransferase NeuD family)